MSATIIDFDAERRKRNIRAWNERIGRFHFEAPIPGPWYVTWGLSPVSLNLPDDPA